MKPHQCVLLFCLVLLYIEPFTITGCSTPSGPVITPVANSTPTVILKMEDGLDPGDIVGFLPGNIVTVSPQFRAKYDALFALYPVGADLVPLPVPDWTAAQQPDGSFRIDVAYVNAYRALAENHSS
jgi:hypothetical protein